MFFLLISTRISVNVVITSGHCKVNESYINDLESNMVSSVLKFADDTKLLGKVNNTDDSDVLQLDLK